jgi:hypothetical protein
MGREAKRDASLCEENEKKMFPPDAKVVCARRRRRPVGVVRGGCVEAERDLCMAHPIGRAVIALPGSAQARDADGWRRSGSRGAASNKAELVGYGVGPGRRHLAY